MEGMILGNRYQLIERIGGGGMALVYKAKCNLLNRFVAVKILRPEFTTDKEFIERFKIESQAAASLSHPNIVSIYDVGNDNDVNYIVMEYVDGVTLKEYITEKGLVPWKTAVNIAMQICSALEHAHKNHIVHRDIKPHNIILTKEMIAKVTDFGIARAVSSSTLTATGNTIGSVHYFSPEQARGGYTDEKSDIYSLGIVLYEMLTGKVPYDGDTPVTIALKHLEDEMVPPIELDGSIPKSVNDIVLKAVQKNQASRYQSATEMLDDLYSALKVPNGNFVKFDNEVIDTHTTRRVNIADIASSRQISDKPEPAHNQLQPEDKNKNKNEKVTVIAALITSLLLIGIISAGVGFYVYSKFFTKTTVVKTPNIVGMNIDEAKALLIKNDITVNEIERRPDEKLSKDLIISQNPIADMEMRSPGEMQVVVSSGQEAVTVPDLTGMSYREAQNELQKVGLLIKIIYEPNAEILENYVIRQTPGVNMPVAKNSEVQVFVSDGPENVKVKTPNLIGLSEADARQMIKDSKLILGKVSNSSDSSQKDGVVIDQSIMPNTEVSNLSKINITVNKLEDNPDGDGNTRYISIDVTKKGANKTFMLRVEVDGVEGKKIFMNEMHSRDEKQIDVPVKGIGSCMVRVYIDDRLDSEMEVDFGGEAQ
ncbi:MAG: Stk1 family PASTA domain-containing Ser/Thr kinase [Deltaproteobacteria bacterium]